VAKFLETENNPGDRFFYWQTLEILLQLGQSLRHASTAPAIDSEYKLLRAKPEKTMWQIYGYRKAWKTHDLV